LVIKHDRPHPSSRLMLDLDLWVVRHRKALVVMAAVVPKL
jgi:hypothetical protein